MRVLGASTGDMVASRGEVSQNPPHLYYSWLMTLHKRPSNDTNQTVDVQANLSLFWACMSENKLPHERTQKKPQTIRLFSIYSVFIGLDKSGYQAIFFLISP